MSGVWLQVTARYGSYTIQRSCNSETSCTYLHVAHWITYSPVRETVFKLNQKTMMTAEHVLGVVGGEAVTHAIFYTIET